MKLRTWHSQLNCPDRTMNRSHLSLWDDGRLATTVAEPEDLSIHRWMKLICLDKVSHPLTLLDSLAFPWSPFDLSASSSCYRSTDYTVGKFSCCQYPHRHTLPCFISDERSFSRRCHYFQRTNVCCWRSISWLNSCSVRRAPFWSSHQAHLKVLWSLQRAIVTVLISSGCLEIPKVHFLCRFLPNYS